MNTTIAIAFDHNVLMDGVLPDLESPDDIIAEAPITQVPTEEHDDASWGFIKRGRRFPASRSTVNVMWAAAIYAPEFGIGPKRAEQFISLLKGVNTALGDDVTPDEVYVAMSDLLAGADDIPAPAGRVLADAWRDLLSYQDAGGVIFDPETSVP